MNAPLFLERRFLPMWTALSLGAFADNMLRQALLVGIPFGVINLTGLSDPTHALPVLGSIFAVSMLIFSPLAGQFAEKYETGMMFRRTKLAEVALMAAAAVGFAINSGWFLIIVLFAMAAQSAFFSPVRMGAMPKYLRADELVRGNGLCNAGLYASILIGLFLGGLLIEAAGGRMIVASLLLCAALIGWIAILFAPGAKADLPGLEIDWNIVAQGARILHYAFAAPGVARPALATAFFFFVSTLVTVLAPHYARVSLGADGATATAIMGVFAVGAGAGALAAAALSRRRTGLGFSTLGIALAAGSALAVYLLTGLFPAAEPGTLSAAILFSEARGQALLAAFGLSAAFMGLFVAPLQAAMQRRAPAEKRSRIMAASNMLNALAATLGSLSVFAVTFELVDARSAFVVVAGLQALVAAYMIRRRRVVPSGLHDEAFETGETRS